jgi:hypothetical protein
VVFALGHWAFNISEADYSPTSVALAGAVFVLFFFALLSSFASKIVAVMFPDRVDQVAQLQSLCNTVLIYIKVICILICELVCWPFMCGMMVDRAAMVVFNTPVALRVHQARESLEWFLLLHWGLGVTVLTFMSWSLVMARRTFRPEVMWFLRDPDDPAFDPLREIIVVSVPRHVLRFFVSTLLYGPFVFATIVLPLLVAQHAKMLPLAPPQEKVWLISLLDDGIAHITPHFSLSHAFLESLASLAAAWLFSSLWKWNNQPFIKLIRMWSHFFGGWLGLTEWLLPVDGSQNAAQLQQPLQGVFSAHATSTSSSSSQPKVSLLFPRLLVFVAVTFFILAAVPTVVINTCLALSIAFLSPTSNAQCPTVPVNLVLHHSFAGSCSISNLHESFVADPRSFVVPPDKSLQVSCVCVILVAASVAGAPQPTAFSLRPPTSSTTSSHTSTVVSMVPWAVASAGKREFWLSGFLACVRWTSCMISYCIVIPYFLCHVVSLVGTS